MSKLDELFGSLDQTNEVVITRKAPICILVDRSGSMSYKDGNRIAKIDEVNKNITEFIDYVQKDTRARKIADVCIISFATDVKVENGYSSVENIVAPHLTAYGSTSLGHAISTAMDLLELRRNYYRQNNIEHFKPIMLLMTDGESTEAPDYYQSAALKFSDKVKSKEFKVFPVGIGKSFNISSLRALSPLLEPKQISTAEEFSKLFELLSSSSSRPEEDPLGQWWNEGI